MGLMLAASSMELQMQTIKKFVSGISSIKLRYYALYLHE